MFKKYKEKISVMERVIDDLKENNRNLNLIISSLNEQIKTKDDEIKELHYNYDDIIKSKKLEIKKLDEQLNSYELKVEIQRLGFDDIKESLYYKDELANIREKQRRMLIDKTYYNTSDKWYVNGDLKQGDLLIKFLTHISITSFNLLCDNCMDKVNISNNRALESKIKRTFENYNNELSINSIQLNKTYLNLKLDELDINYKIKLAKDKEKEERLLQKEILKEQVRVEKEIEKNKSKLEKKLFHLIAQKDSGIDVEEEIKDIKKQLDDDNYMLTNNRAGYVYIIQSKSFTNENQFKIGMTRQLDPLDRIAQLSDASIPFKYYPVALIFTDDAFGLEAKIHKRLEKYKVNKFNPRKEHFIINKDELIRILRNEFHLSVEFKDFVDEEWIYSENTIDS